MAPQRLTLPITFGGCNGHPSWMPSRRSAVLALAAGRSGCGGRGGVLAIIFWPYVRKSGQQTAADVIRHIEYAINLCSEDHVGIGIDLGISPVELTPAFVDQCTDQPASSSRMPQAIF